jgi:hypothetical protein
LNKNKNNESKHNFTRPLQTVATGELTPIKQRILSLGLASHVRLAHTIYQRGTPETLPKRKKEREGERELAEKKHRLTVNQVMTSDGEL